MALANSSSSFVVRNPPSPELIILSDWQEYAATCASTKQPGNGTRARDRGQERESGECARNERGRIGESNHAGHADVVLYAVDMKRSGKRGTFFQHKHLRLKPASITLSTPKALHRIPPSNLQYRVNWRSHLSRVDRLRRSKTRDGKRGRKTDFYKQATVSQTLYLGAVSQLLATPRDAEGVGAVLDNGDACLVADLVQAVHVAHLMVTAIAVGSPPVEAGRLQQAQSMFLPSPGRDAMYNYICVSTYLPPFHIDRMG